MVPDEGPVSCSGADGHEDRRFLQAIEQDSLTHPRTHAARPVHARVIPKGRYVSMADFAANASADEHAGLFRAIGETARVLGLEDDGYRVLTNHGRDAHQEVMHFHFHLFGGRRLGPMLEGGPMPPSHRD